jgi:hypothetical protein
MEILLPGSTPRIWEHFDAALSTATWPVTGVTSPMRGVTGTLQPRLRLRGALVAASLGDERSRNLTDAQGSARICWQGLGHGSGGVSDFGLLAPGFCPGDEQSRNMPDTEGFANLTRNSGLLTGLMARSLMARSWMALSLRRTCCGARTAVYVNRPRVYVNGLAFG